MKPARVNLLLSLIVLGSALCLQGQTRSSRPAFSLVRLKYGGGGDWYNDPSMIPNLHHFLRTRTNLPAGQDEVRLSLMDEALFAHPVLFMTGHGRISFSEQEAHRLRTYLTQGGFLLADDDYGMDEHFRREMKKVFPDKELLEIPFSHPLYSAMYPFHAGLPKIHEHDGDPPKGFGYFHDGRLVVFYVFNSNISDGWADPEVHGDPPEKREQALRMGANIIIHALTN